MRQASSASARRYRHAPDLAFVMQRQALAGSGMVPVASMLCAENLTPLKEKVS